MARLIHPVVKKRYDSGELWLFRGQYFQAYIFSDGVVQLFPSDKEGRRLSVVCLNSFNGDDYEGAVRWLNENVE